MGQHERASAPQPERRGFWATLRFILRQPPLVLLSILAVLTCSAVLAVRLENAYGSWWGAVVGTGLGPLIATLMLRVQSKRRRP
jgi:hypothetical protein